MRYVLGVSVLAVATFPAAEVRAQSKNDIARADEMFNAGKALAESGQYADACAKFAESKRLVPGLGVTLYLADCYEHIGRSASAWVEFRSAEGLARERNDKRAGVARERAQAIEPKLSRLSIVVSPSIPRQGLQVLRDGLPVAEEELGLPEPVDVGDHVVVVSAPGHKMRSYDARISAEHQNVNVQIDSLDDGPRESQQSTPSPTTSPTAPLPQSLAASASAMLPTQGSSPSPPSMSTQRWIGLAVGGLGVIGLGVGGALGLVAVSKRDQSNGGTSPPCDAKDACSADGLSLRKDAEGAALGSTIAFVAGGLALATGIVVYVTAPRAGAVTGWIVAPLAMSAGGGAIVRANF